MLVADPPARNHTQELYHRGQDPAPQNTTAPHPAPISADSLRPNKSQQQQHQLPQHNISVNNNNNNNNSNNNNSNNNIININNNNNQYKHGRTKVHPHYQKTHHLGGRRQNSSNQGYSDQDFGEDPTAPLSTTELGSTPESTRNGTVLVMDESMPSVVSNLSATTSRIPPSAAAAPVTITATATAPVTATTATRPEFPSMATVSSSHAPFREATFGHPVSVPRTAQERTERCEQSERVIRFAQKRLKKSHVEDYYQYQCRRRHQQQQKQINFGQPNHDVVDMFHSDVQLEKTLGNGSYNVVYSVKKIRRNNRNSSLRLDPDRIVIKTLRSKLLKDLPMLAACAADLCKEGLVLAALQKHSYEEGANHVLKVLAWTPTGLSAFANGRHDSYFIVLEKLDRTLSDTLKEWKKLEEFRAQQRQQRLPPTTTSEFRSDGTGNDGYECSLRRPVAQGSRRSSYLLGSAKDSLARKQKSIAKAFSQLQQKRDPTSPSSTMKSNSKIYQLFETEDDPGCSHKSNGWSFKSHGWTLKSHEPCLPPTVDPEEARFWTLRMNLLIDLCSAVAFLHSQKVLHRDLKPDNVGFDRTGTLKVFDFDVARVLPPHQQEPNQLFRLTKKVGSPRYMSPEVARGEPYNESADVYAIGLLAYEVLNLKRPFDKVPNTNRGNNAPNSSPDPDAIIHEDTIRKFQVVPEDCVPVILPSTDGPAASSGRKGLFSSKRSGNERLFSFKRIRKKGDYANVLSSGLPLDGPHSKEKKRPPNDPSPNAKEPKYANLRPLLPVATPRELAEEKPEFHPSRQNETSKGVGNQESQPSSGRKSSSNGAKLTRWARNMSKLSHKMKIGSHQGTLGSKAKPPSATRGNINHFVNEVDFETGSFYWTRALRTIIDRAWSYDIPSRPSSSSLQGALRDEVDRINYHQAMHNVEEHDLTSVEERFNRLAYKDLFNGPEERLAAC
eukprot:CAMPEP_0172390236 /NCGR_PEP_ID=MMETSP1061-20121228/6919_1 /TAXON_ID=37318 /ORGANISM="Pseudo-nitzschia pungens, Strain cf. pungens" /LENGTH=951 /DNA_ID=CAMNT_0013120545 /DNA_START=293 /DNA_END=3148 /DNA_ORIENTATION=-